MVTSTSNIPNLLRPGVMEVFADTSMYKPEYREIFTTRQSDKQYELEVETRQLPIAAFKAEGAQTQLADMGQQAVTTYFNRAYALGYVITREAVLDNLYKSQWPQSTIALRNSMRQYQEVQAASVLNNGFNSSFPIGDGVSLYNTAHPILGGTVSNTFSTPVQLNETSLQDAIITVQLYLSASGIRNNYVPVKAVVPTQLQFTIDLILNSKYRTGTANNDISAVVNMNMLRENYTVNHYLTSSTAWFLLTDCPNGFTHYEREAFEIDLFNDVSTDNTIVRARARESWGNSDFRSTFGTQGA